MFNGDDPRLRQAFGNIRASPDMVFQIPSVSGSPPQAVPHVPNSAATIPVTSALFAELVPATVTPGSAEFIPAVHSRLNAISLELNEGEHLSSIHTLLGPFNKDTLLEFLKYAAYLSSNNMFAEEQSDRFLQWIIANNKHSTLRAFFSVKLPTIDAFARSIFESALRIRNADVVQILLKSGVNPNHPTRMHGKRPLHVAAVNGNIMLAQMLLDAGADINALSTGRQGKSALHFAVLGLNVEMAQMLLQLGANVNESGRIHCSRTALQGAAEAGYIEFVKFLLHAGADINAAAVSSERVVERSIGGTALQLLSCISYPRNAEKARLLSVYLVNAGADVNATASWNPELCDDVQRDDLDFIHSVTALQGAVRSGKIELVKILLEAGANVNAPAATGPYGGKTALQEAASRGSIQLVQLLLAEGADLNAPATSNRSTGRTALQAATESGYVDIVQILLDRGADVNAPGYPALSLAICVRLDQRMRLVTILLDAGADVTAEPSALVSAAGIGDINLTELLLNEGAGVNGVHVRSAYEIAMLQGHTQVAAILLNAGADFSTSKSDDANKPLSEAVVKNDIWRINMLLSGGAKINEVYPGAVGPDETWVTNALPIAANMGNVRMVQFLLDNGAVVDASSMDLRSEGDDRLIDETEYEEDALGRTALLSAVRYGRDELITLLLNAGANVNARPQPCGGWTALQAAAKRGSIELVRILLEAGAEVNAPAHFDLGRSALQAAAIQGHIELVRHFLNLGADVNAPAAESRGVTALQGAAIGGQLGIALTLLKAGADPNAQPSKFDGRTALEGAAEHGRLDMVQLLLNAGADIGGRDGKNAERARDLALKNGHAIVAEVLNQFC